MNKEEPSQIGGAEFHVFNSPSYKTWEKRYDEMTKHWYSHSLEGLDLTEKELGIINARKEKKTLEQVGKEFGVTRERIRQIEAKAQEKIRQKTNLKDFIREICKEYGHDQYALGQREGIYFERQRIIKLIENFKPADLGQKWLQNEILSSLKE